MATKIKNVFTWQRVTAGVTLLILLALNLKQCSDKERAESDEQGCKSTLAQCDSINSVLYDDFNNLKFAYGEQGEALKSFRESTAMYIDSLDIQNVNLKVANDSIVVLNDSIVSLNGALEDCAKKSVVTAKTTPKPKKPKQEQKPAADQTPTGNAPLVENNIIINPPADPKPTPVADQTPTGNAPLVENNIIINPPVQEPVQERYDYNVNIKITRTITRTITVTR